jgi:uncharacterized protein (TIGR03435 family)
MIATRKTSNFTRLAHAALLVAASLLALVTPSIRAQAVGTPPTASAILPAFEVASVKKNKSDSHMMRIMGKPDGFACDNIPLKILISNAYGIKLDLITGGPGWVETEGFDIDAKVAGPDVETYKKLTDKERQSILAALLVERFNLKIHRETKILPIYELVVAKGGFKPKELPPIDDAAEEAKPSDQRRNGHMSTMRPGEFQGGGIDLGRFAENLSDIVQRTVLDKTGIKGIYDINLKWTPEDEPASADAGGEGGASVFTALQEQVGLKLESGKGPVETLVIDHADLPSQN